jgi:hypothetical protein
MSHPDPLFDPDNAYEDDDMIVEHDPSDILLAEYLYDNKEDIYMDNDTNYDDYNDFHDEDDRKNHFDDFEDDSPEFDPEHSCEEDDNDSYDDSMDGDHDSAMESAGWGLDEDYGFYGDYGEDY